MSLRLRVAAIVIAIFSSLVYLVAWSSLFSVRAIEVSGQPASISARSIISKSEIKTGTQLARIEPRSIEKRLGEISWIDHVDVYRHWIGGKVSIEISPRIAVGIYGEKALDKTGTLFEYPGSMPTGLPQVSSTSPALGLTAIELFTRLPIEIRDQLQSVTARNASSISSIQNLDGRAVTVNWGSIDQIPLKVSVYQALIALPENKTITRVDLSAPHAPIVK